MAIPGNFLSSVTEAVDPNTSGWTAMLNCSISLGTGGRNGDGVLSVKSVASGEMRARTVSAYPVVVGTMYAAFADALGATVPERIGIRWLTAAGGEISITWSMTTSAAAGTWHRIAVAGAAPASTARAQVVVSSSPVAAAVISQFENVFLGLPVRTLGNLLDFNTESAEVDASGWAVDANCTLARQAPPVTWPVDYYLAGGHVLAMSVTATGNASAKTAAVVGATAGVQYLAFGYINPPTSASNCWIELRFLDSGGSVLTTQRSALAAPGTAWYRQVASAPAPAGTAGIVVAVGITAGTAAQVVRFDSVAVVDAAAANAGGLLGVLPAASVVPFADASFEQGVGTWTTVSGVAALARSTPWGSTAIIGSYSLKVTSSTATTSVLRTGRYPVSAVAGDSWAASVDVNVAAAGWTVTPDTVWYDASNTVITSSAPAPASLPGAGWWVVSSPETVPTGAVSAAIQVTVAAPTAGAIAYLDKASLQLQMPDTEMLVSADTASVQLTVRGLVQGEVLTLWRVAPDGTRTLVRGESGLMQDVPITAETLVFEDYEAPLGVEFSYYDETHTTAGVFRRSDTWGTAFIPFADRTMVWLKDPGNPQRNLMLMVPSDGGPDWERPVDQAAYVVKNRRNKVTLSGIRNGREGSLVVWTRSDDEREALDTLLDSGNVLLWQTAPGVGVGNVYAAVGQAGAARGGQDAGDPWRTWTLPLVESDMPVTTGVNGSAGRTWQDVLSEFASWADVLAAYETGEDLLFNRRKE